MNYVRTTGQAKRRYTLFLIVLALIVAGVYVSNALATTYIDNHSTPIEQIDNFQKLADNLADTARQMQTDEQRVRRAVSALQQAELILADSTQKYNDAIEAWSFYQEVK